MAEIEQFLRHRPRECLRHEHAALLYHLDGEVEIGVGHHNCGRLATGLKIDLRNVRGGIGHDLRSGAELPVKLTIRTSGWS
jgi:hypothetical protein